jgi:hypothetical protein
MDHQILPVLEISSFASLRQRALMKLLPETRMHWYFTESLSFVNKKLRWIPDGLSEEHKRKQVEKTNELLQILISMKQISIIYYHIGMSHGSIWQQIMHRYHSISEMRP